MLAGQFKTLYSIYAGVIFILLLVRPQCLRPGTDGQCACSASLPAGALWTEGMNIQDSPVVCCNSQIYIWTVRRHACVLMRPACFVMSCRKRHQLQT